MKKPKKKKHDISGVSSVGPTSDVPLNSHEFNKFMHGSRVQRAPLDSVPREAPVPPQGAPGGSGRLGAPKKKLGHGAPRRCLGCSSQPPLKSLSFRLVTPQARHNKGSQGEPLPHQGAPTLNPNPTLTPTSARALPLTLALTSALALAPALTSTAPRVSSRSRARATRSLSSRACTTRSSSRRPRSHGPLTSASSPRWSSSADTWTASSWRRAPTP